MRGCTRDDFVRVLKDSQSSCSAYRSQAILSSQENSSVSRTIGDKSRVNLVNSVPCFTNQQQFIRPLLFKNSTVLNYRALGLHVTSGKDSFCGVKACPLPVILDDDEVENL